MPIPNIGDRIRITKSGQPSLYGVGDTGTVLRVDPGCFYVKFDNVPPRQGSGSWWMAFNEWEYEKSPNDTE